MIKQSLEESDRERPRGVAAFLKQRRERIRGTERPIPPIVWVSLAMSFSGLVTSSLPFGLMSMIAALVTGLVLGSLARRRINGSNGTLGGLVWANIAIGLNLLGLIQMFMFVVVPWFISSSRR